MEDVYIIDTYGHVLSPMRFAFVDDAIAIAMSGYRVEGEAVVLVFENSRVTEIWGPAGDEYHREIEGDICYDDYMGKTREEIENES